MKVEKLWEKSVRYVTRLSPSKWRTTKYQNISYFYYIKKNNNKKIQLVQQ